jgi:hypothetical protein
MSLKQLLIKRAGQILLKSAFQPMPGGQPPADPNAGGAPAGAPPADPSMAGGAPGGAPPMDPSMMGGAPGGMPMDPSMMGGGMMPPGMAMGAGGPPPATVGQLSVTDFQTIMTDMLTSVLSQIMGGGAPADAGLGAPPEVAPQDNKRTISNTEISEKLDALMSAIGGGAAPDAGAGVPPVGAPAGGEPGLGFGGVSVGEQAPSPAAAPGGMEIQAGVHQGRKNSLADVILKKAAQARKA